MPRNVRARMQTGAQRTTARVAMAGTTTQGGGRPYAVPRAQRTTGAASATTTAEAPGATVAQAVAAAVRVETGKDVRSAADGEADFDFSVSLSINELQIAV